MVTLIFLFSAQQVRDDIDELQQQCFDVRQSRYARSGNGDGSPSASSVGFRLLARWFDATEQYPQQLHEVERGAYLQMKAQEVQRQQTAR
ncbi:hypothetical protein [Burkholderia sp. BCC1993]|uniref:hypothetical protein n=1 Tax=Burkholderia sp. BCC1993 TaxID=2817444 RepID=UPI002AB02099|nr:hypothetical protein [Burkholderia sp. BCC1993]